MKEVRVAVTGAAGQIGYALLFRIASGQVFGPDTRVHLQLLELEQALPALGGVKMELDDCAFPLLASVKTTSVLDEAFDQVDWALLVGSVPRKAGMERSDLLKINGKIFIGQGESIARSANENVKVLVVGNPCNTNAWICYEAAKGKIKKENIFAMTMLDQNRAYTQIAQKSGAEVADVKKLAIWGNHSPTMYPDFENATVEGAPLTTKVTDEAWLKGEFLTTVQKRGAAIIEARGASSAASAANAVIDTLTNLNNPTAENDFFSVAVRSNGEYGIPEGLIFSYPIQSKGSSEWKVVEGLPISEFAKEKLLTTQKELESEREAVASLIS